MQVEVGREMLQAVTNMDGVQRRIPLIAPAIAILTFSIAAIFGWSIARRIMRDRPEEVQKQLETAIEKARQAITEGRAAIHGVRSSTLAGNELAHAITLLRTELTAQHKGDEGSAIIVLKFTCRWSVPPRELAPILRDDIYRISGEAMCNALLHAKSEGSRSKFATMQGSFACASWTMEKVSTRRS